MKPIKDSDYHKLSKPHEKICYLNGMPKLHIKGPDREPEFTNFKANSRVITAAQQRKAFEDLKGNPWGPSHSAFFLASPHDRTSLETACQILRRKAQEGFRSFEFISPFEELRFTKPGDQEDTRELFVLLGAHENDREQTQRIRRWVRQPHGAAVWVVGVAKDPYRWAVEDLGVVPQFMFFLKKAGVSVG